MNYGIVHLGENKPDPIDIMTVAIRCGDRLRYQERGKQTDLTVRKTVDSLETAEKINEIMCECYPNYQVVKGMPQSVFADPFGYDMQNDIYYCMTDYYAGKISESDVKDYLEECCVSMRIYRTQKCQTSGHNVEDNQQIVGQVYEIFAKMNARAGGNANYEEGLAENQKYGGRSDDWVYYNSDYYYQCEETKDFLRQAALYVTDQWEIPAIDAEEIEKNTGYTLDGGLDFNSGWNWEYRNQMANGSMEDESVAPPKDFKLFFKQNSFDGTLWVSLNGDRRDVDVPFSISHSGSLKGQIYRVYDLLDDTFKAEHKKDRQFLSGLTVFMSEYTLGSGINNIFGNHVPRLE
ncbi:MAG: hypothetical protein HDR05_07265 [Lachnospiraceae bacterium]|nr:hypothetical protein [Lachnospiraceae bacterium]